jgi:hypothetical protein
MGCEVQGRSEALNESDRAIMSALHPMKSSRSPALIGEEGTQKSSKDLRGEPRIPGAAIAQRIGKRQNPLPNGNFGQDMVDERSGSVRHPPPTTRRTESTSLAREGNEPIVSTRVAMDSQESVSEYAALEIRPNLSLHEPGNGRALPSRPSQEGLELLADDFVEQGLFGFMAFVFDGDKESIGIVRWSAVNAKASDVPSNRNERPQAKLTNRGLWSDSLPIPRTTPATSPQVHTHCETAWTPRCSLATLC